MAGMAGVQRSAQKTVENQMGSVQKSNIPYTKSDSTSKFQQFWKGTNTLSSENANK